MYRGWYRLPSSVYETPYSFIVHKEYMSTFMKLINLFYIHSQSNTILIDYFVFKGILNRFTAIRASLYDRLTVTKLFIMNYHINYSCTYIQTYPNTLLYLYCKYS